MYFTPFSIKVMTVYKKSQDKLFMFKSVCDFIIDIFYDYILVKQFSIFQDVHSCMVWEDLEAVWHKVPYCNYQVVELFVHFYKLIDYNLMFVCT
jgi:hypothetical protein